MQPARILALGIVSAAVIFATSPLMAPADLPKPKQAEIVPFKSMDGVPLGLSKAKALKRWGGADNCAVGQTGHETCRWLADSKDSPAEGAFLELIDGRVCGMLIRAGNWIHAGGQTITGLKNWKTKQGIGLGSSLAAAKKVLGGESIVEKDQVTTAFLARGQSLPNRGWLRGGVRAGGKKVGLITVYERDCYVT